MLHLIFGSISTMPWKHICIISLKRDPKLIRDSYKVCSCALVKIAPLLSRSECQGSDLYGRARVQQHLHFGYVVDLTCTRRLARQPIVPPNRRRAASQRGQMGTYYMNLSPETNPGGLIRLRMIIEMICAVSYSGNAIHNVCGNRLPRSHSRPSPWARGVALLMVRM